MKKTLYFLFSCLLLIGSKNGYAETTMYNPHTAPVFKSVTLEGGPVATKHFQTGEEHFRERHGLGVLKAETYEYGSWGFYFLNPNSVDDTSLGVGYLTKPYIIPLGPTQLELSAGLGLVTGYQDYPLPLLVGEARLTFYENGPWNFGVAMAALPYVTKDRTTSDTEWGIVATSPFLSVRYSFGQ